MRGVALQSARLLFALALLIAAAGTGAVSTAQGLETAVRVVAVDGETGAITVVDPNRGEVVGQFTVPYGGFSPIYASGSGRYIIVHHYEGDAVTIIDSGLGLRDHGDHVDLVEAAPYVRATVTTGANPAHYWAHDGIIAVYNDGDGSVTVLNETQLDASVEPTTFEVGPPDHASIALLHDILLVGFYDLARVDAYQLDGTLRQENVGACAGAHGEGRLGDAVAFACADGILVVTATGNENELESRKIPYPGDAAELPATPDPDAIAYRTNLIAFHDRSEVMVGDLPDGLAIIQPEAESLEILPLPSRPLWMSFNDDGSHLAVLTDDGAVHAVDPAARQVLWSTRATSPYAAVSQADAARLYPFVAASDDAVYVPDPMQGEIVEVNLESGQITSRIEVGGQPARVALVMASGITH